MQHTHTHKAVTRRVEAKNLLSRRRQSNSFNQFILHLHKHEYAMHSNKTEQEALTYFEIWAVL